MPLLTIYVLKANDEEHTPTKGKPKSGGGLRLEVHVRGVVTWALSRALQELNAGLTLTCVPIGAAVNCCAARLVAPSRYYNQFLPDEFSFFRISTL